MRELLEQLEHGADDDGRAAALAYLAGQRVELDEAELNGARRRALLLVATGGDPRRELRPDDRAVRAVAGDLDSPGRRAALEAALRLLVSDADGLPHVEAALARLLADADAAWTYFACALLAEELAAPPSSE